MSTSKHDPNTFEAFVHDDVGLAELHPGGVAEKKLTQEEAMVKVRERQLELVSHYVKPHNKKGRIITAADVKRVVEEATLMSEMCLVGRGDYTLAPAIAHTQVNDTDPLRFFVYSRHDIGKSEIYVNPIILNTTGDLLGIPEGCLSFPEEPMKSIMRFNQVKVQFQTLYQKANKDGMGEGEILLTPPVKKHFSGFMAKIFQHEVAHLNGKNMYDKDHSALDCENGVDKEELAKIGT